MASFARNTLVFDEKSETGKIFCNTYTADFHDGDKIFPTVEHFLAYHKAKLAGDSRMADIIMMADTISLVRKFSESIINHDEAKWQRVHLRVLW